MMGVHAAVAKSLQEIPELRGKSEQMSQDLRMLEQLYASEQQKTLLEREKAQNLEGDLERLRSEGTSLRSRLSAVEDSERNTKQSIESLERKVVRREKTIKALGRRFKRVLGMVKVKLRGARVQAIRDFLSSGSHKSRLIYAKGNEFSAGFRLAVDQAI